MHSAINNSRENCGLRKQTAFYLSALCSLPLYLPHSKENNANSSDSWNVLRYSAVLDVLCPCLQPALFCAAITHLVRRQLKPSFLRSL